MCNSVIKFSNTLLRVGNFVCVSIIFESYPLLSVTKARTHFHTFKSAFLLLTNVLFILVLMLAICSYDSSSSLDAIPLIFLKTAGTASSFLLLHLWNKLFILMVTLLTILYTHSILDWFFLSPVGQNHLVCF